MLERLTTHSNVGIYSNVKAVPIMREQFALDAESFAELVIWQLPAPLAGSSHHFKYRLALIRGGRCVLRYDNEAGKGDHKHLGEVETDYAFVDLEQLQVDFWTDVAKWMDQ